MTRNDYRWNDLAARLHRLRGHAQEVDSPWARPEFTKTWCSCGKWWYTSPPRGAYALAADRLSELEKRFNA